MSVKDNNVVILSCPAEDWQEGFLLGNGFMGQAVYGQPWDETVDVSEITFFQDLQKKRIIRRRPFGPSMK